ncbi:MAG: PD40 domain-containing protein [Holophagales bacterium]|nr:PD40 domain-containing protein [Holophagales bacterium]
MPLRLTTDPALDSFPAWSPDGTQIAFRRQLDATRSAIVVVPAMGGPERRLAEGRLTAHVSWSRDGSALFLSRCDESERDCGLAVLSVETGQFRRLTRSPAGLWAGDQRPEVSPDGRTIAFTRASTRSNSEIYLLPLTPGLEAAGEPRRLTYEESTASEPAWTPDGKSVVFSVGAGGSSSTPGLRIIPASASGEKAERLEVGEGGESPTISSTGRLAWARWTRDENIWRLPLAGGAPERLVCSTRRDNDPHFSPDGKRITFASDRTGSHQIWIANADGSDARPLTATKGTMAGGGRWSPDGRSIVFVCNEPGQMELYLTTPEGRSPRRLTDDKAHDSAPSFSRDGRWIYFASNRDGDFQVWKIPADGGAPPVRVTRNGGYSALESSDGRTLYYGRRGEEAAWSLWSVPVGGGEETLLLPRIATWGDFDVGADGIYFIDTPRAGARILLHPFGGSAETLLGTLEKRTSFGVTVAPDERTLLYTQYDQESTELMLVDRFR